MTTMKTSVEYNVSYSYDNQVTVNDNVLLMMVHKSRLVDCQDLPDMGE